MRPGTALLAIGAAARLTRLVTRDSITDVPRAKLEHWANVRKHGEEYTADDAEHDPHWATQLVNCPWCIGFWITAATVTSAHLWGEKRWWQYVAGVWASSFAVSTAVVHA
ncbi:DUF1360 domain-containing protein [Amycolatopsis thermophila]|uniref:DUF1360 domain-containing protein n=1 Tax=Amycolatopsis thermophila TaxID=206084 RepID=A0ABU0EMJ8_9PSEU|nr:DUF1360 domain-containing protein [Amycolatopsis thermophila]MDQ0376504.1 hypothetical protein [Amycolatopsis thermophila]